MSEKRLVRIYIGGQVSPETARTLVERIKAIHGALDDYWSTPPQDVDQLVAYAVKEKWVGLRHEDWPQAFEELEEWCQEERIPYDEVLPPFGEFPGVIAYYRPAARVGTRLMPRLRVSRNCDFFGNPILEWREVRKVLEMLRTRTLARARTAKADSMLEELLGKDVHELPPFEMRP